MLLHFGRVAAKVKRFSFVIDKIDVKLVADDGPELGAITVLILAERLLVKLIKEPFESPEWRSLSGEKKINFRWGVNKRKKSHRTRSKLIRL